MKAQSQSRAGVRSAARKLDLACQRTLKSVLAAGRFWPLAAPAGGLIFAQAAIGQTTYEPALSDIQIVQNAGVGDSNASSIYINVPGVAGTPPSGFTASPYPILTSSLVTATYQLVNTFTNAGPPSTSAYGSIGEANNSTDVTVDLGTGSGITQTNPNGAYGHASELSFNVNTLAFFVAPSPFFPANHSPTMIYQFGLGGTLPAHGSANFGVSLSFYFYATSNTTSFSFTNTNITGTKLASISMSETFSNSTAKALAYTNLTSPSLYSGSALLANGQLITVPGYIDVVGSINMQASVDGQPGGSNQNFGMDSTTSGNWSPSPSSFAMYLPQPITVMDAPSSGDTFDATGPTDLAQTGSWTDATAGNGAQEAGPPSTLDVAQFYSGIIVNPTTFTFSSPASWGGLSVVNPGAAVILNGGGNMLSIGGLGVSIEPDANGVSQNLTVASATKLVASQIWQVTGGQTLAFSGSTLNLGNNDVNLQDSGNVVISSNISDGGSGGSFMMNSTGTLFLSGNNSFSGGILMNSGEVSVASDANLGGVGSGLTFNGGALQVTGNTLANLNNHVFNSASFTGGLDIASPANTFTISQNIGNGAVDGGTLTKLGAGTLTLSGSNTFYGNTNIDNGVLRIATTGSMSSLSTVNINTPQGLVLSNGVTLGSPVNVNEGNGEFINLPDANETATLAGSVTVNPNDGYDLGFPNAGALLYVTGANTVAPAQGIVFGEGNLTFAGNGSLIANTADVPMTVGGGSVPVNLTLQDNSTITDTSKNGSLQFESPGSSITVRGNASLNMGPGGFSYGYTGQSALNLNGGTMVVGGIDQFGSGSLLINFNGGVLVAGQSTSSFISDFFQPGSTILAAPNAGIGMAVNTNGFDIDLNEAAGLTGGGGLTKLGQGELYIDTDMVSSMPVGGGYSGATTVDGGLLELFAMQGSGGTGLFDHTPYIQVAAGGAVGVDTGSTSDIFFLQKFKSSPSEAGGFALAPGDSAVSIDFSGFVTGSFNMTNAGGSGANLSNMSIGALANDEGGNMLGSPVVYTATITPATSGPHANTYLLGGGGTLELATVTSGNNALSGVPLNDNSGFTTSVLVENGGAVYLPTVNTYTGVTTIAGTMVLANPNTGSYDWEPTTLQAQFLSDGNSSIGNSTSAASNLVINGGVLQYLGNGEASSRLFTIGQYGATLDSSGTAAGLLLSNGSSEAFSGGVSGVVTLTLTGSNTGTNQLNAALADPAGGQLQLVKSGPGFWELSSNSNSFSGGTFIGDGTLVVGGAQNLGTGPVNFDGGMLQLLSTTTTNLDSSSVNWSTFNGGISLAGGTFIINENLQGTGVFVQSGNGKLILGGTDNTISGGVGVFGGTLAFSNFNQLGTANIDDYATLEADLTAPAVFSGNIDGTGNFIQAAGTSLTLNGNNSYAGWTGVGNGATLVLDYSTAADPFASILGDGSALLLAGGTLQVNPNSFLSVGQNFASTGFTAGPSAITLNTSTVNAITVNLGSIVRTLADAGATVEFNAPVSGAISGIVTTSGGATPALLAAYTGSAYVGYATFGPTDWAATTAQSGGVSYIVPGSAINGFYTTLTQVSSYTATSNLDLVSTSGQVVLNTSSAASIRFNLPNAGLVNADGNNMDQVDIAGTFDVGAFLMTPNVGANDVLITPNSGGSNQHTQDIVVSGGDAVFWQNDPTGLLILNTGISANSLTKQGPGAMAINATSTYTGPTYIEGGILEVPYDAALGSGPPYGNIVLDGGSLMAVKFMSTGRGITLGSQGGGLLAAPGFIETINNGISGLGGLSLGSSAMVPIAPVNSGNNSVTASSVSATGTVVLAGTNTYQGPTSVLSGLLQLGNASALGSTSALNVNSGATLDLNGFSVTVPSLSGGGAVDQLTSGGGVTLDIDGSASTTFSGDIRNSTGVLTLIKAGTGTLTLSGDNTYSGTTQILGGELSIGSTSNISNNIIVSGGALQITGNSLTNLNSKAVNWTSFNGGLDIASASNTFTVSQTISGGGSLEKLGAGTLALTGSNTYTGETIIAAGTLLADSAASLGSGPVVDDGVLLFTNPGTITVAQNISGSGGLTSSQQNLVLTGNNTYIATTTVNAGDALTVTGGGTLPMNGEVVNNGMVTLNNPSTSLGGISGTGTTIVSNASTLYASGFSQTSLINNGTATIGCGGIVGSITGSGTFTLGTDSMVGQLQLTGSGVVNQQSGLSVFAGSQLDLTRNSFLISFGAPKNDPVTSIVAALASGYNNDTWTGAGIMSSNAAANPGKLALGYVDGNTDPGDGAGPNQLLIKFTVAGDANLDGQVNFTDLLVVAQNYNKTGEDWAHGNFNFSPTGLVNFGDLLLVAQNFNQNVGDFEVSLPTATLPLAVKVPEPSAALLMAAAGAGMLARRRRRARPA